MIACQFKHVIHLFFLLIVITAIQSEATDQRQMGNTIQVDDITLVLNGAGFRTAYGMRIYKCGLYLLKKNSNASEITDADQPMAIRMIIVSSLITGARLEKTTREGFANATNNNLTPIDSEINTFMTVARNDLKKGDDFMFIYTPQKGTEIIKNQKSLVLIKGLPFKKALFGIWLCDKPPQKELKEAMLSAK
jgi:hypothetical protein